jgi:outer membrane protein assembly factor BamB
LDAETGEESWCFEARPGYAIDSSPIVAAGMVFFGSNDGYLYVLDAESGEQEWRFETNSEMVASPVIYDGALYVATITGGLIVLK